MIDLRPDQLEGGLAAALFDNVDNAHAQQVVALTSIAISLKRVADALHGDEKTTGLVALIGYLSLAVEKQASGN